MQSRLSGRKRSDSISLPRLSFSGRYHNFDAICPKQLAGTLLKELLTKVSEIPATVDFDVCGRVFEYFLGEFARTEGQKGGEFYTPRRRQKPRKQPRSEAYCAAKRAAHDSVKIPAQSSAENQQARLYRREMRE